MIYLVRFLEKVLCLDTNTPWEKALFGKLALFQFHCIYLFFHFFHIYSYNLFGENKLGLGELLSIINLSERFTGN